jgi:hypothetical protein
MRSTGNACCFQRTIDGNSHALREDIAIGADEGRDLAQLVVLQVLWGGLGGVDLDSSKVEVVGLRNSQNGRRARVGLGKVRHRSAQAFKQTESFISKCPSLPRMCRAFRTTCWIVWSLIRVVDEGTKQSLPQIIFKT